MASFLVSSAESKDAGNKIVALAAPHRHSENASGQMSNCNFSIPSSGCNVLKEVRRQLETFFLVSRVGCSLPVASGRLSIFGKTYRKLQITSQLIRHEGQVRRPVPFTRVVAQPHSRDSAGSGGEQLASRWDRVDFWQIALVIKTNRRVSHKTPHFK